ncbi:endonuclease Q family protein [Tuberibacillus sp. Marseille-P3662]|uniref:endonuclease Q family protein n=1 Tax=Tuberibacillus sp. Marseille-P3662 TaxID=1965358 RepID=UPI000A1CE2BB|nr:endonuclease Q family protein [Tuberibacillus sp. Marseille-P3662]
MKHYYSDLHIHLGRTPSGRPVKITGSDSLTIDNILTEAFYRKGMDIVGVIDCHVPEILEHLKSMASDGAVDELADGGVQYQGLTLMLGTEIEVYDHHCHGPAHVLAFFPYIHKIEQFSQWLAQHVTNITLSTQRYFGTIQALQTKIHDLDGLFIPAHIFTPFKSAYGVAVKRSLGEIFDLDQIDAVELGLSADTGMADQIPELHQFTFLTNSDAHSTPKIAREYQTFAMEAPTFSEFRRVLKKQGNRNVVANYGLNPRLGKYHKTCCAICFHQIRDDVRVCPYCGSQRIITGVSNRLQELKSEHGKSPERPPYIHQVPLEFIPKVGPKTLTKLITAFGSEMNVMHEVSTAELQDVVGRQVANLIVKGRDGSLAFETGGAGRYGRVKDE